MSSVGFEPVWPTLRRGGSGIGHTRPRKQGKGFSLCLEGAWLSRDRVASALNLVTLAIWVLGGGGQPLARAVGVPCVSEKFGPQILWL